MGLGKAASASSARHGERLRPPSGSLEGADVGARAEGVTGAGEHQDPHGAVGGQLASSPGSARHISGLMALRLAGLLMVTVATPSTTVVLQSRLRPNRPAP